MLSYSRKDNRKTKVSHVLSVKSKDTRMILNNFNLMSLLQTFSSLITSVHLSYFTF